MATEVREALCGLCRRLGWSYGACWRFDRRDPRFLVMSDSYYEEQTGTVIDQMMSLVHLIGEGTVGIVAVSGKHHWIYSDTYQMEPSSMRISNSNAGVFEGSGEWQHQFLAGVKTIAIISLPSFGVVQFGSTKKIHENLDFIIQVCHLFHQLGAINEHCVPLNPYSNEGIHDPSEGFAAMITSPRTFNCINSHRQLQNNTDSSVGVISSRLFESQSGGLSHHPSAMSVISSTSSASCSSRSQFHQIPSVSDASFPLMNQCLASDHEPQAFLLPNKTIQSSDSFSQNSFSASLNTKSCALNQRLLSELATNANQFLPDFDDLISSHLSRGSQGKLRESLKFFSSLPSSPIQSSTESFSFPPEFDNLLNLPQCSAPDHASILQSKDDPIEHVHPSIQRITDSLTVPMENNNMQLPSKTIICSPSTGLLDNQAETSMMTSVNSLNNDLFEGIEFNLSPRVLRQEFWDEIIMPVGVGSCSNWSTSVSDIDMGSFEAADKGLFSGSNIEQLLEAAVSETSNISSSRNSVLPNVISQVNTSEASLPELSSEEIVRHSSKETIFNSNFSSWIELSCNMNAESVVTNQLKKSKQSVKVVKKRARPGESTRPRPKDRQLIQDRVKELLEIVPNGAKCSIDSLLDRTVRHMLFLQSVAKYADKLKQTDEPKMIGDASGVVLKDKSSSGDNGGGATWAYEVEGQTMVCPILVEDTTPPGQMLVEMLCEERGFFLEIADVICSFGLTILKGVMEIRDSKIWVRFLVEANRNVTRMDIFFSLVQLLQQTCSIRANEQQSKVLNKGAVTAYTNYQQPQVVIPIGALDRLQ